MENDPGKCRSSLDLSVDHALWLLREAELKRRVEWMFSSIRKKFRCHEKSEENYMVSFCTCIVCEFACVWMYIHMDVN